MGALAYQSEDAARAAAAVIADAERDRVWVRCLIYAVGRVLWSCAFDKPVMAAEVATEAADALLELRRAFGRLATVARWTRALGEPCPACGAAAAAPCHRACARIVGETRRAAVEHLLEVWPRADARLRRAVLLVLRPRHVRPLCTILADALDAAELDVERELAKKGRARAGRL